MRMLLPIVLELHKNNKDEETSREKYAHYKNVGKIFKNVERMRDNNLKSLIFPEPNTTPISIFIYFFISFLSFFFQSLDFFVVVVTILYI